MKLFAICFSHIHSYLNNFGLLITSLLVKGWLAVKTIAPLSFITLSYCSHNNSKGIIVSHLLDVIPYGKSHKIISTLPSGIRFIPSRQSSLYILFSSGCIHYPSLYALCVACLSLCVLALAVLPE